MKLSASLDVVRFQFPSRLLWCCLWAVAITSTASLPAIAQPPATEEKPQQKEDEEEGMRRFWRRFGGGSASIYQRSHRTVRESFVGIGRDAAQSTVRILVDGVPAALGTIVDANGLILTKGSELRGSDDITCELYDNRRLPATQVGDNDDYDFALLRVDATNLKPAPWYTSELPVGSWLVTVGLKDLPVSIGVVSTAPRRILKSRALIGVRLGPNPQDPAGGAVVGMVFPNGGADRAGLKINDVIIQADDRDITTPEDLIAHVSGLLPGDRVKLRVKRNMEEKVLTAELMEEQAFSQSRVETQNSLGGPISRRRSGFPRVIQHDSVLRPEQCGGPLINLDGKVVGINIARGGRVASYAIPSHEVLQVIPTLVEKMDTYREHLLKQKLADLQQSVDKVKQVLKKFEDRLAEAIEERDEVDPEKKDELVEKTKRVDVLKLRVTEAKDRVKKLTRELDQLREQPVTKK